jgi:hypothetical protein
MSFDFKHRFCTTCTTCNYHKHSSLRCSSCIIASTRTLVVLHLTLKNKAKQVVAKAARTSYHRHTHLNMSETTPATPTGYKYMEYLGSGGQGTVCKVQRNSDGKVSRFDAITSPSFISLIPNSSSSTDPCDEDSKTHQEIRPVRLEAGVVSLPFMCRSIKRD